MACLFSRVRVDTACVVDLGDILAAGGVEPWLLGGGANDAPADVRLDHTPELSLAQHLAKPDVMGVNLPLGVDFELVLRVPFVTDVRVDRFPRVTA